jgi:ATP-binding cassette, subfamily B, bacterial
LTGGSYAPELRIFDLGGLFVERFRSVRQTLHRERKEIGVRRLAGDMATQTGSTAVTYGVYAFVVYQVLAGTITLGDFVMYTAAFQRAQVSLQELMGGLTRFYEDNLFLKSLSDLLGLRPEVVDPEHPRSVPRPMRSGITIEHLTFQYRGAHRPALDDVSLTIHPGQRIALVGPNGSGKTTLLKLLCRLYDPSLGRIMVDGMPVTDFAQADWRREIAVLSQQPAQFHVSARENIWLGSVETDPDDARIVASARRAGAHSVIERLPEGYDTPLGKWLEEGEELSVGEWQRIALARTSVRDAQLLLLDEPTSAVDPLAERDLLEALWSVAGDRMTVLISHRLSSARMADRIYVMDAGRIVESGTHDELMGLEGLYAKLFTAQAEHYQVAEPAVLPS